MLRERLGVCQQNYSETKSTAAVLVMEQARRDAIVGLARTGHGPATTKDLLGYPKKTVYGVCKNWKMTGTSTRKAHKSREDKKRSAHFLAGLKQSIKSSPGTPMSVLAKKGNVSKMTVSRGVKENLKMSSYRLYKRHILTPKVKASRLKNGKKLL